MRLSTVAVVWLGGLVAGFFALLATASRYECGARDHGLACRSSGTVVGVSLVVAVIALVTAVTVLTQDRPPRSMLGLGAAGLLVLIGCLIAARALLATV